MLLNSQWIAEEIKEEIEKYLDTSDNKNTMVQNLWETAKAVLRGTLTAIQSYLGNQEKSQINNVTFHLTHRSGAKTEAELQGQCKQRGEREISLWSLRSSLLNLQSAW